MDKVEEREYTEKNVCKHCGKKIEYVTTLQGLTVICPHCKRPT